MCQKTLSNQATKAWFAVKSKLFSYEDVKPDVLFKMYMDRNFGLAILRKVSK